MGLFGSDSPNYGDPALDPEARAMIQEQVDSTMKGSSQKLENAYLTGVEDAKGLLQADQGFDKSLAYGDKALSQSIQKKFSKEGQKNIQRTKEETGHKAKADYFKNLQGVAQLVGEEQRLNHEKAMAQYQAKLAKQRARGAILGQVLGIGGAIVGAGMGGPMGAMAGYQIGTGVGGMAGG